MTCIVQFSKKSDLINAIKADPKKVTIEDPSIFNPRLFTAAEIQPGETIYVTNHPKRSWFAQIKRTDKGLKVA